MKKWKIKDFLNQKKIRQKKNIIAII